MENKLIFYDLDILINFLAINEYNILRKLFSKIIVPQQVYDELINIKKYKNIKKNLKTLINEKFIEIREFDFNSPEDIKFNLIYKGYWTDGKPIGKGESAAIAFAIENNGIVASNNLSDVFEICDEFNIPIITAPII